MANCNHVLLYTLVPAGLGYKELSGRPKNLWGVHNKMQQKRQELDRIYDLRAIRVIVEDKTDCYSVLRQVTNLLRLYSAVPHSLCNLHMAVHVEWH